MKALNGLTDKSLSLLPGSGTNHGVSDAYCFIRKYDWHGNLLSDHVPGGRTHLHYDLHGWLDQIVTARGSMALFREALRYAW